MRHSELVRRVRLLNLVAFKFWGMVIVFVTYALMFILPVKGEAAELLLFVPAIFLLEEAVNGKKFSCPRCKTPFKLRYAALIIASGRCYCCNNELFELPPASVPVFERQEFTAFHRHKLPWKNIAAAVVITAVITFYGMILAIPEMVRLGQFFREMFLLGYHLHTKLAGVVFLFFALIYAGSRIFSSRCRFSVCPHCHGQLDGIVSQVAIATGRCGHCGKTLLFAQSPIPENAFARSAVCDRFPAELHWFIQAWIAVAVMALFVLVSKTGDLLIPVFVIVTDLIFLLYLALPVRCKHKRINRIIQRTGNCGVCGKNLANDKDLFIFPEGNGIFIPACDRGSSGKLLLTIWIIILLISVGIGGKVLLDGGGILRFFAALIHPAILLILYVISAKRHIPISGVTLDVDRITLMSRRNICIKYTDIVSVKKSFYTGKDKKTTETVYTVKTAQRCYNLRDFAFADPEQFRLYMDKFVAENK